MGAGHYKQGHNKEEQVNRKGCQCIKAGILPPMTSTITATPTRTGKGTKRSGMVRARIAVGKNISRRVFLRYILLKIPTGTTRPPFKDPNAPKPPSNQGSFYKTPQEPENVEPVKYQVRILATPQNFHTLVSCMLSPSLLSFCNKFIPPQDFWAALLFIAHLGVIFWMAFAWGLPLLETDVNQSSNTDETPVNIENDSIVALVSGGTVCTLAAAAFSYLWLKYILKDARGVITFMLMANIGVQVVTAVLAMLSGQLWLFIMACMFAMMSVCYFRLVRNRIPFASTNLAVACRAVGKGTGPVVVSFAIVFLQLLWQFVWTLAMMGAIFPKGGFSITQGMWYKIHVLSFFLNSRMSELFPHPSSRYIND